jgi:hypothetical protein
MGKVPRSVVTQNQVRTRKSLVQVNRKGVMEMGKWSFHRKAQITKKEQWNGILRNCPYAGIKGHGGWSFRNIDRKRGKALARPAGTLRQCL